MYQLLEELLPWFLGLYVLDSVAFEAANETLFVCRHRVFAAVRGPFVAGLLPWSEVVSAAAWSVRFSRAAVHWPEAGGFAAVAWESLGPIEQTDRTIRAGGRSLRLPSPRDARHLAALLARLRDTPPARREAELASAFRDRSDVGALRGLRERADRHGRVLAGLGAFLLVGLFVVIPLGLGQRFPWVPDPARVLAMVALAYVAIVALSWRTLRSCGVPGGAALGMLSNLFFLPATAAHVRSFLARHLYAAFDPLALAAVFLPEPAFRRYAREAFHRIRTEGAGGVPDHARLAEAAWRQVVSESGRKEQEILSAPTTSDFTAASYCPLCSTEYRPHFSDCSDCRVALLPLAVAR